jgi:glycosyltransferase involved in cell wall biosynthesis
MPYAILESLARGLPVVATDLPAQRAVIAQLPGSRVVAAEPDAIAGALRELLALTPDQRSDHATLARARVAASYGLDAWAERVSDLYRDALARGQRS